MNLWVKAMIDLFRFSLEYRNLLAMGAEEFTFYIDARDSVYSDWSIYGLDVTVNKKMELKNIVAYVDSKFLNCSDINERISDLQLKKIIVNSDNNDLLHNCSFILSDYILVQFNVPLDNVLLKYCDLIYIKSSFLNDFLDFIISDESGLKYDLFMDFPENEKEKYLDSLNFLFNSKSINGICLLLNFDGLDDLKDKVNYLNLIGFNLLNEKSLMFYKKSIIDNYYDLESMEINLTLFNYLNELKLNGINSYIDD